MCKRGLCQGLVVHLWQRDLSWRVGLRLIQMARSLLVVVSLPVLLMLGGKGGHGDQHSWYVAVHGLLIIFIYVFQVGMLSNFLINGEALLLTGLCWIWFRVTIFSLGHAIPCSYLLVVQCEGGCSSLSHYSEGGWELLSKGAIEPSSGGAGLYSSVFVVPKCTGGLLPILNLKQFNCYLHILPFKVPTVRHVLQLIQHGDYAFSIDLQGAYLHIPIVKHHYHFLWFAWHNIPYQWKVLRFGLATAPRVFMPLTKPILFLCHCKGFFIVIYLDDILVLLHCKWVGKMAHLFLCSLLVCLWLHIYFFQVWPSLLSDFLFLGVLLHYCLYVSIFTSW